MSSALSSIDPARRRQLAARLGLLAVLFLAVGVLACTRLNEPATVAFAVISLVIGLALAFGGWRVARSLSAGGLPAGQAGCTCGRDHDMSQLHITDECAHDGAGVGCGRDCASCALAGPPAPRTPTTPSVDDR